MPEVIVENSPLGRAKSAAEAGDLQKLNAELPVIAAGANAVQQAADAKDLTDVLDKLGKLGVQVGKIAEDVVVYVGMTQAAIRLLNAILDLSANAVLGSDTETTAFGIFANNEFLPVVIDLSVAIDKQSNGFVILDNSEQIVSASVALSVQNQMFLDSVTLFPKFTAFGIGQDSLDVSLSLRSGDGTGPDKAMFVAESSDTFGVELTRTLAISRSGTSNFAFQLKPAPGVLEYGINGGNVAIMLEVQGMATFKGQSFPINKAVALDMGLSI